MDLYILDNIAISPDTAEYNVYSQLSAFHPEKVISSSTIDAANCYHPCLPTQMIKYVWMDGLHLIAINHRHNLPVWFELQSSTIDTDTKAQVLEISTCILNINKEFCD